MDLPEEIWGRIGMFLTFQEMRGLSFFFQPRFLATYFNIQEGNTYYQHVFNHVREVCLGRWIRVPHLELFCVQVKDKITKECQMVSIVSPFHFQQEFCTVQEGFPRRISSTLFDLGPLPDRAPLRFVLGMELDAMDTDGIWQEAVVEEIGEGSVKIKFRAWKKYWNVWYPETSYAVAPFRTYTKPWRDTMKKVEYIEKEKWYPAIVVRREQDNVLIKDARRDVTKWYHQEDDTLCPMGTHILSGGGPHYAKDFHCLSLFYSKFHGYKKKKGRPHMYLFLDPSTHYHYISDRCV